LVGAHRGVNEPQRVKLAKSLMKQRTPSS
jgi:hypothetical protein